MAEPTDEEKRRCAELKEWALQRAIANADQCLPVDAPSYHALLAQRDELLAALQAMLPAYRLAVKLDDPNTDDPFSVAAHIAIAHATGRTK